MSRFPTALGGILGLAGLLWSQAGGEPFKPGKLPKEEQAALVQGLTAKFLTSADRPHAVDVKRVRVAALHVPASTVPTPFLSPGPYTVLFTGYVKAPIRSEYTFQVLARGRATLSINQKE